MKFLVRWLFRLCILLLVLTVALVLLKDTLAKAWAEYEIRSRSGMDARIGTLELGLFSPTLTIEDLKVFNEPEFGGSAFLDIPELHLEYDLAALSRRRIHVLLARVSLAEVNVVEAKNGRTNIVWAVDDLASAKPAAKADRNFMAFTFSGIDTLNLTLGKLKFRSLRRPEKATDIAIGMKNGLFTNVKSISELKRVVLNASFQNGITINQESGQHQPARRKTRDTVGAKAPLP